MKACTHAIEPMGVIADLVWQYNCVYTRTYTECEIDVIEHMHFKHYYRVQKMKTGMCMCHCEE